MKPKTTGYSETFPLPNGGFRKMWHEWDMEVEDDPREALYKAKRIVQDFFWESLNAEAKQQAESPTPLPIQKVGQSTVDTLIAGINSCTYIREDGLESYKLIAEKATDQRLKDAYTLKYNELLEKNLWEKK